MMYQSYAYGMNHWDADRDLRAILKHFWPAVMDNEPELHEFGRLAGSEAYEVAYHVDHEARPILVMHDLDGNRIDRVRLDPAQRDLLRKVASMNRPPYEGGSWHHHFALGYMLADPGLYCIMTITGQTVYAIHKYAPEHAEWKEKLLSGDMFGATWMSESQGGSDLGANQSVAHQQGDGWLLTGDKYFASGAGLTDVAIATARPEGARSGPKGLALFLVPRVRQDGGMNYRVRRLKDKSATRAVPSGEVELDATEAILIGKAEDGIYYTLENLTVSRLANAVAAMGIAKKSYLEVLERVRRRSTFGRLLKEHPLIRRDLTDLAVRSAAGTALAFRAVEAFDGSWQERPPYTSAYHYARFLSHLAKNRTADHSAVMTAMAMELFGGVGFMDDYAVARWHREALITPIWEGPSNIQALDFLEAMQKKQAHELFVAEFVPLLDRVGTPEARLAKQTMEQTLKHLASLDGNDAQWYAKDALTKLADVAQVGLLYQLAATSGDRYERLAQLYAIRFLAQQEYPAWARTAEDVWWWGQEA